MIDIMSDIEHFLCILERNYQVFPGLTLAGICSNVIKPAHSGLGTRYKLNKEDIDIAFYNAVRLPSIPYPLAYHCLAGASTIW